MADLTTLWREKHEEDYSLAEEMVHAATHGAGALAGLIGLIVLLVAAGERGDAAGYVAAIVYGGSLVVCYLASALYHAAWEPKVKDAFLALDHAAIFLLIAGTYTPIALLAMPPEVGQPLFLTMWAIAAFGIAFKLGLHLRGMSDSYEFVSLALYLGMGWLGLAWGGGALVEALPAQGLLWLVVGGLLYTLGVGFYLWRQLKFNHVIWHFLVLAASASHFIAVLEYVLLPSA
jgi:hemolysin III